MPETLTLTSFGDFDRSGKVRWIAHELGLDVVEARVRPPEHRAPAFLAKNPLAGIPVVEFRGRVTGESTAIGLWLAEELGGRLVIPPGHPRRADFLWWVSAATETCEGRLVDCAVSRLGLLPPEVFEQQSRRVRHPVGALADRLPAEGYVCGEFTVADVFAAYSFRLALETGLLEVARLGAWWQRVQARPAAVAARFFP